MKQRIKRQVQSLVVATSFPPFKQLYIGAYWLVIWLTKRRLAGNPAVLAVYLKRSCATGDIVPGISDIDMAAVVTGRQVASGQKRPGAEKPPDKLAGLNMEWYYKYVDYFPILEDFVEIKVWADFQQRHLVRTRALYRLAEAKATWRVIHGEDLLAQLPDVKREDLHQGTYTEIFKWWKIYLRAFFKDPEAEHTTLMRNSVCFRICCEVIRVMLALQGGPLLFSRRDVLHKVRGRLTEEEQAFAEKLQRLKAKRFRPADAAVVDEATAFLLAHMDRGFGGFDRFPLAQASQEGLQRVDYLAEEAFARGSEQDHLTNLVDQLEAQWGPTFRGAHLAPSVVQDLDSLLLLVRVDPQRLPTTAQLGDLLRRFRAIEEHSSRSLALYLLLPNGAYFFDEINQKRKGGNWCWVLPQACSFDVFSLLNQAGVKLRGGAFSAQPPAAISALTATFVSETRLQQEKRLNLAQFEVSDPLDFSRTFWKYLQLTVMSLALARGALVYPLTLPAIERGLAAAGIPLPAGLSNLSANYRELVAGRHVDLSDQQGAILDYLLEVDSRSSALA